MSKVTKQDQYNGLLTIEFVQDLSRKLQIAEEEIASWKTPDACSEDAASDWLRCKSNWTKRAKEAGLICAFVIRELGLGIGWADMPGGEIQLRQFIHEANRILRSVEENKGLPYNKLWP